MPHTKLSQQLMDAYMIGDQSEIKRIKSEIDSRYRNSLPKKKTNIVKVNTVLNDDDAPASVIYDFLNKSLDPDWWEWEFETIEKMLWIKYGVALEDINRDKIWAIRHVCRSDGAFADWFEFNQTALSFSGCIADFDYLRNPSPGMTISTVKTLNHIRPDRKSFFSNDVLKYICIIFKNDGLYTPPPSINNIIQSNMEKIISPQIKSKWVDIFKKYRQIVNNQHEDMEDSLVNIQAKRLLKAEKSALKYGTK